MNDTTEPQPIRKSSLPCTPPPEFEFRTVFGARSDTDGCALFPGDAGPVVVRRLVTYGDWEPVRPDRWADEPESDAASVVVPAADRAFVLTQAERDMLTHALDLAEEEALSLGDGDVDAVDSLRRMAAESAAVDRVAAETPAAETETVHACPPDGSGLTPCCGRTPFELPRTDRMTSDPAAATCRPAVEAQPGKDTETP